MVHSTRACIESYQLGVTVTKLVASNGKLNTGMTYKVVATLGSYQGGHSMHGVDEKTPVRPQTPAVVVC